MSGSIVLLVLISAFLHAVWNAILKRQRDPELSVVAIMIVAAASATILAHGTTTHPFPTMSSLLWSIAAGAFEAGYFVTLAKALARAPLGSVYTIARGGALLAIWPISVVWLGERITWTALAGTILVAGGLAFAGRDHEKKRDAERARVVVGLLWATGCALFIAGYHLCYKRALGAHGVPSAVVAVSLSVACVLNVARLGRARAPELWRTVRTGPVPIAFAGLLATASFVVFLGALDRGGAGAIVTLRNTSVIFAQGLAWVIGEKPHRLQVCGAILVAAGAIVLAWLQ